MAIFNPYRLHRSKCFKSSNISYYQLYLDQQWCIDIQKELFCKTYKKFIPLDETILNSSFFYKEFIFLLKKILSEKKVKTYEKELRDFVKKVFNIYCDEKLIFNGSQEHILLRDLKHYIKNKIDKNLTLEELSEYSKYSKNQIINIFKKHTGQTPKRYIINQKINQAKDLLINNDSKSIIDIANETGFYDQSHFNKSFKKIYGVSPKNYTV